MGKKVNPIAIRLGITTSWKSKWFGGRNFAKNLKEDIQIREAIMKQWKTAAIADVSFERRSGMTKVVILTSRPGMLIGRGGTGIEDINRLVKNKFFAGKKVDLKVEVKEIRQFEENAQLVAQQVAEQLEKRMPFRRVLKSTLEQVQKNNKIKGVKIEVSGRLGGAEMSRREWLAKGTIPLHTLRADIDFSRATARTTYGAIGIKVWIYKGEVFE
ncbi:MAG: 30S ribosomal protein S3 [Candidatus Moranbacteria bacterium]|jgi:small subunit ribosomal protein S3|nr:30S ribosomal protein S3 [Candidatus Moranbacteria bacterium]